MNSKNQCENLAQTWEFMPNSSPPFKVFLPQDNHLIFFGGSFNPWHKGHLACIKALNRPKNLFVIPDHNPQKELLIKKSPWQSYLELREKIPQEIPIYPGFWANNKKNPTSFWIQNIQDKFPHVKISLLMGFDSFLSVHKWIESEALLKTLHSLYIVSRQDDNALKETQRKKLKKDFPHLELIFLGRHDFEHLSSREIRKKEHKALE